MEITWWSITSQWDWYIREDMLLTYDENERQQIEINKNNAWLVFSPKFIPFYPKLLNLWLNISECLVYWFIDFYLHDDERKFYFTNEQIGEVFWLGSQYVSNIIKKLKDKWLIDTSYKIKANWWSIRFIKKLYVDYNHSYSQGITTVITNNNKINNNKKNNISSKEEISKAENDTTEFLNSLSVVGEKKEKSSAKKERKDITELILILKDECRRQQVVYDNDDDRVFSKHILDAKHFWEVAEWLGMTRPQFAVAVLIESIKNNFWKWYCTWPKKIYNSYVEIVNKFIANRNKQSNAVLDDL